MKQQASNKIATNTTDRKMDRRFSYAPGGIPGCLETQSAATMCPRRNACVCRMPRVQQDNHCMTARMAHGVSVQTRGIAWAHAGVTEHGRIAPLQTCARIPLAQAKRMNLEDRQWCCNPYTAGGVRGARLLWAAEAQTAESPERKTLRPRRAPLGARLQARRLQALQVPMLLWRLLQRCMEGVLHQPQQPKRNQALCAVRFAPMGKLHFRPYALTP